MIEVIEGMAKRMGFMGSPLGLVALGAAALVAKSPKGRRAARSVAVGAVGLVLGVVDGAKELTSGMRSGVMDMVDEARARRTKAEDMVDLAGMDAEYGIVNPT